MFKRFLLEFFRPVLEDELLSFVFSIFSVIFMFVFGVWLLVTVPALFYIFLFSFLGGLVWFTLVPHTIRSWKRAKENV